MMKYRLYASPSLPVVISLDVNDPDEAATLTFEGQEDAVTLMRDIVASASGMAGHGLGGITTAPDLAHAMESEAMAEYRPELLEGAEIIEGYVREAPPPGTAD